MTIKESVNLEKGLLSEKRSFKKSSWRGDVVHSSGGLPGHLY
jgi:hypothetical protein